uniref:Doublecortin domain-containing protein n=2 Tax=Plectus sambesii TaxID=2011161 RepID=A0A914XP80_9BILA
MTKLPPDVASSSSCESAGLAGSPANTLPRTSKKRLTFDAPTSMTSSQTSQTSTSAAQAAGGTTTTTTTAAPNRSFIRLCQKARRVRFFRNGDQYFKGVWYAISPERFRSFEVLLEDLTRSLVDLVNLPQGVRCMFTLDGATKVSDLDELKDGESYVCSSSDVFKRIDYLNAREPVWSYALPKTNGHLEAAALSLENSPATQESNEFVHPRLVTVIRSGVKPRRVVRLLLNKRTARTFRQVVGDITAMVKLDSGVVRKLFTLDGKQVTTLADFFADDDVFIAYGTERMSIDDFYLDSEEYKFLFSSRGKSARSGKSPRLARRLQGRLGEQFL